MKHAHLLLLAGIAVMLSLPSCLKIYGIKKHHHINAEELARRDAAHKWHTDVVFDTNTLKAIRLTSLSKDVKKNMMQPLQVWVIANKVVCNKVNCYTKGYPNLKWKLPEMYETQFTCSPIEMEQETTTIKEFFHIPANQQDTTMVVAYSYVMGRQNKRFMRACRHLQRQHPQMKMLLVNMDNTFD